MTVYLPLTPVQKLFQNHVIETSPALSHDVIASIIDSNILNPQVGLKKPEQSTMCSGQEGDSGESYPEKWVDDSCSEKGVDDAYLERSVDDSCSEGGLSEIGVGNSYSERGLLETDVDDTYSEGGLSEIQVGDSYSESGHSDSYSDIGVEDPPTESQFNCHLPVASYSIMTRSKSRCILNSTTRMTRSLTRKMQEGRYPSCRCESCRETKQTPGEKNCKVRKDSNNSSSVSEVVSRRHRSGSCSRWIPRGRRSKSLSVSRNSRERHYSQSTFSDAEIGVYSSSECDSSSERGLSDTCSVMGLSDTYSEIWVDYSQMERQYDCHLPVTSYSSIVTSSRSRYVLNSNTHTTKSLTKKIPEKKDCEIHEDCDSSCSLGEEVRGRRSGSRSRGIPRRGRRRRRSRSRSSRRNTRKRHSNQNTFSPTEPSYSECDSNSEKGLSDTCSVMGLSDTYSDVGVEDTETESQFNCHIPVTSCSIMTRSKSRCVLNSTTRMTRSLTRKMQEGRFPSCRCETCRQTKEMLEKEDLKFHKDSKVHLNRSVDSCGLMQYRRSRRHNWGRSTIVHQSVQNSDGSLALMNRFRASLQVRNGSGIKQEYVAKEIDYLNNGMYKLNVTGNSQSRVVCNSGIDVKEVTGSDYSSNVPHFHNSENIKKQICCINEGTEVEGAAFCGCLNGHSKREEALRVHEIFSVPPSKRRRVEEGICRLQATEMASGSLTD